MKAMGLIVTLLIVSSARASQKAEGWIWWTPPKHITKEDRHGLSDTKIARMGLDGWFKYAEKGGGNSYVYGVDSNNIVYGACLASRNDRLIAHRPAKERPIYKRLRADLFRFAMACIAMEDTLAGGGTYSVHYPHYISHSQEDLLYAMLTKARMKKPSPNKEALFQKLLHRYATVTGEYKEVLFGTVKIPTLHKYAKLAEKYYGRCLKEARQLAPAQMPQAWDFIDNWLVDYLDVREADKIVLPKELQPKEKSRS